MEKRAERAERIKPVYYTLKEQTTIWTGPRGRPEAKAIGKVEDPGGVVVRVLTKGICDGSVSFLVEVVKPPEKKGDQFWVAKLPGSQKGFFKG